MRKLLVKVLTLILAFTSLFALSLFTGCDCGDNGGSGNVIPKPEDKVERYLNLDVSELNLIVGDEHKFTASYIKEEGKTLTFESADANIATVGAKGELLAYNEGSTTITAKYGDLTATCNVNVSFGNYLPELVFASGDLDVYNLGLDGIPYTFSPVIKFNGKTFTDAEVTFVSANDAIAKFDNADVKGISLGETTATVSASWRGFTVSEVPALQKVINIKTHNVVNFLINDQTFDVMKLSTFNGDFEGTTYSNVSDFDVKIIYNGQVTNGNVQVDVADSSKVNVSNGKITARGMGKTDVTLSYKDSNNQVFNTVITVEVIRPVADSGMKFNLFSAALGYYKDVYADLQNKSVIKDVLGNDASKVTDAYVVDGIQLKVEGDKILNLPVAKESSLLNKIVIGTATYAYTCEIDTYGALVADKEDLAIFDVHFTNADETEYSYVNGYCELLRDIDATGFKPKHTAVHTVNPKVDMYNSYGNYYVGFRGTFNGKGFTIFNLDTTRDPITYINKNGNKQVDSQSVGLFGYIAGPATIKNVAFENMKVVNGSGITYRGLCSVVETTTTPKGNCTFENIYISLSEDSKEPKGILFFNVPGSRFNLRNVVINAPNLDVGDETSGGLIDNNGTGLEKDDRATYDGVVVISKYPLGFFSYYTMYGGNEKMGRDMYSEEKDYTVDLSKYALDTKLGYTPGPNGEKLLYRRKSAVKKYNNISEMAQDVNNFSKFPDSFWKVEKDENGGQTIFWKSLLGYSYDLYNEDGEIFDSVLFDKEGAKPYKFTIKNSIEPITNYTATVSDSNVLEVKNGAIYLKQYKIGYYEVTLSFTSKFNTPITRVIPVTVDAKHIATYLQQDGEVVNHGLTELPAGASFSINGVNVAHTFENGKLKVDLSGVDLSEVALTDRVDVYMKTSNGYDSRFVSMYVTLAIDEAEELNYFNVGYTFNQAEYDALTSDAEKIAYLEKCEAEPFKYFDGYYVLAKDIDATGIKFNHEAAVETPTEKIKYDANGDGDITDGKDYYTFTKGDVGFLVNEATNTLEARNNDAPIVGPNGKEYMIPRDGYPIVGMYTGVTENDTSANKFVYSGSFGIPAIYFKKIGFMGTFDGQGHIITNLDTQRYDYKDIKFYNDNKNADSTVSATSKGAGLFGIINAGCKVQNVAFVNTVFSYSALLAMYGNTPHSGVLNTNNVPDILTIDKYQLENVYISAAPTSGSILSITCATNGAMLGSFKDVIVDMTNKTSQYLLNPGHFSQTNSSLYAKMERVYFASTFDVPSAIISRHTGKLFFGSSMADLYANTNILEAFAENPYFEVLTRNGDEGVFFKGTYASTFKVTSDGKVVDSITLDKENLAKELVAEDAFGVVADAEVEISNTDVLEYANGIITVKENGYAQGDYEVTIKVTANDAFGSPITLAKTIKVILAPNVVAGGYLQTIDGEITGHGLTSIEDLTFSIDGVETEATLTTEGKLLLDLANVDLSDVKDLESVDVYVANANGDDVIFRVSKLLLAIDEASDLTKLNVGYTYDQAEFEALTSDADKVAYLKNAQENPYDFYEGLVILTKDIDATGVEFKHEAVFTVEKAHEEVGFLIGEVGNTLTVKNANAPIVFDGVTYNIPRAGYPAVKTVTTGALATAYKYMPGAYFYKMGFLGTFDGQGHVITNLNTVRTAEPTYYNGTEEITAIKQAPGIFGVVNAGTAIKNVALVNAKHTAGSVFALIDVSPAGLGTAGYHYDEGDIFAEIGKSPRTIFENMYIDSTETIASGLLYVYNSGSRGAQISNIVINYPNYGWASAGYSNLFESGILGGSVAPTQANGSLTHIVKNVYAVVPQDVKFITSNRNIDIVVAKSLPGLFTATVNTIGTEKATMAEIFAENEYFEIVARGDSKGVFWKGLFDEGSYEPSIAVVDGEGNAITQVVFTPGDTEAEVYVQDMFGNVLSGLTYEFNKESGLIYEDGKIKVVNYTVDVYELTFTIKANILGSEKEFTKTIIVDCLPVANKGYLQADGEVIEHGLTSIDGAKFLLNNEEIPATLVDGKLKLTLPEGFTAEYLSSVVVKVDFAEQTDAIYELTYVSLAIDEAEDLYHFSVDFTYDEAYYNTLTSDDARHEYLAQCQAQAIDYFDGYYILLKDIDATGIKLQHNAARTLHVGGDELGKSKGANNNPLVYSDTTNSWTFIKDADANVKSVAITVPATDKYAETSYVFPRKGAYGEGTATWLANVTGSNNVKAGFAGTFDGQGHVISNLDTTKAYESNGYIINNYGNAGRSVTGAGLFGIIKQGATIKNLALTNVNMQNSVAFANMLISPATDNALAANFENIYVSASNDTETIYGIFYDAGSWAPNLKNIIIDIPNVKFGRIIAYNGEDAFCHTNGGLRANYQGVYIASQLSLYRTIASNSSSYKFDITLAPSMAELFNATTNIGGYEYAMNTTFADNDYFEIIERAGVKGVFFKGLFDEEAYKNTISFVDGEGNALTSVTLEPDKKEQAILVKDLFGSTANVTVEFSAGSGLEYANGAIKATTYTVGSYEAVFTVTANGTAYTKAIQVEVLPETVAAYLQEDGEIVGHGLTSIDGVKFAIGAEEVPATLVDGKLKLALPEGFTAEYLSSVVINADLVDTTDILYNAKYVSLAIDEATDLQQFGVNYTYNQAEFDALTSNKEKKAYLEDKQANPYTYFEGYVVLTKDIDATGITFNHDAMYYVENSNTDIGYTINEVGNTLTAVNTNAPIVFNEVTYNIPRPGYPAFKAVSSSNKNSDYIPGAFFYKTGFYGTFDGQGYVIDNLNPVNSANIEYYVGETATKFSGYGAGIFGAVSANSTFKNVAFTNYVGKSGPAIALIDITPTSKGTASYNYDENDVFEAMGKSTRTKFTNMYFEIIGDDHASGSTVRFNAGNRGSDFDNIVVDATHGGWGDGVYGTNREAGYLGGGYQWSNKNGSLCQQVDNVVLIVPEGQNPSYTDASYTHLDVIFEHSLETAFSATTNTIGETVTAPSVRFDGLDYFTVVDGIVYWHSLAPSA